MDLQTLRITAHERLLEFRSIERVVRQIQFEELWSVSTEEDKLKIYVMIATGDKKNFLNCMKNHSSKRLQDMGSQKLKDLAKKYRISNYSRMTKTELIKEIQNEESRKAGTDQ